MSNRNTPKDYSYNLKNKIQRRSSLLQTIVKWRTWEVVNIPDITIASSFDNFIKKFQNRKEFKNLLEKEQQATIDKLFTILNRAWSSSNNKKPSTSSISGMFALGQWISTIINTSKSELKQLFQFLEQNNIPLQSITGMQHGLWIPNIKELELFIQFLQNNNIPLESITGMQAGKWIPNIKELELFIQILWKNNIPLQSITGMQAGKWIPNIKELELFIQFLQENNIPLESITGMQAGKWIPDLKQLQEYIQFIKENNIPLESITGMQAGKWIPDLRKLQEFITLCREKKITLKDITRKQLWLEKSLELVRSM